MIRPSRSVAWGALLLAQSACGAAGATGARDGGAAGVADGNATGDDEQGTPDGSEARDSAPVDAPVAPEGSAADAGPFACGDVTCAADQLCVHPCCGGAAPSCAMELRDGGTCPSNLVYTDACPNVGRPGCVFPPCTPPAPFCVGGANACVNACGCSNSTCGACPPTSGRDVMCLCG